MKSERRKVVDNIFYWMNCRVGRMSHMHFMPISLSNISLGYTAGTITSVY